MRRTLLALVLALPLPVAAVALPELLPGVPEVLPADAIDGGELRAGAAVVDATWHVGASQGQYAGEGPGFYDQTDGTVDPSVHATTSNPTHGVESRDTVRALVLDDGDDRWALISNDLYIPQELLNRRVATLLAEHDALHPEAATGITADDLTVTVSHSHSSPFYSSTAWGAWAFQDAFDLRFFEFMARRMADAVIQASGSLTPARAAVATRQVAIGKRNPEGPGVSQEDEPLPAGWPMGEMDATLTLLRVDATGGPPIANWVVWGRHPEGMEDNGLHSGEYVGALLRTLDRELGGVALFSQNDVGTSEITRQARVHVPEARQEYDDNSHNMLERFARALGDEVAAASADISRRWADPAAPLEGSDEVALVPPGSPLEVKTVRFAPPSYRVFPSVSNCRTERTADADPGIPLVGLPDCTYFMPEEARDGINSAPLNPGVTYDTLREAGVPVPDNYGVPSYTGLQESLLVPLQAIRLGGVAFTACPCEQFTDQARNIRARLDKTPGNLWFGWDWTANHRFHEAWEPGVAYVGDLLPDDVLGEGVRRGPAQLDLDPATPGEQTWCTPDNAAAPSTWTCKDPRAMGTSENALPAWSSWPTLPPVSHAAFVRWKARIYNDARGWDGYVGEDGAPDALTAEAEPADVTKVWGNWIHEELTAHGYDVVVPLSMANDYWGYLPPYREFQVRDYYRKALAGLGPHSSDFMATRLTRMAAELNGGPAVELTPKDLAYQPEAADTTTKATAIGAAAEVAMRAYEAGLPPDGGQAGAVLTQPPAAVQRFGIATMQWTGGSNYTDVPHACVERQDPATGQWKPFGDGYGEVQVKVAMPKPEELPLVAAGQFTWKWTGVFETYDSDIDRTFADGVKRGQVPDGTYRFVVGGCHRGAAPDGAPEASCSEWDAAGRVQPYRVESQPFTVTPWAGLTVEDFRVQGDVASFTVGPKLPLPLAASNSTRTAFSSGAGVLRHQPRDYAIGRFDYAGVDAVDYPDTVPGHPLRYVTGRAGSDSKSYGGAPELFCFACALEPWAETGAVARATITVLHTNGKTDLVPATYDPSTGRWSAPLALRPGDRAFVAAGGVVDTFGEINGAPSAVVERSRGARATRSISVGVAG